jgi:hypothetical protein
MRFVSRYGRFGVQIRPERMEALGTGGVRILQEPVYAMFTPGGLEPIERELAVNRWAFNGLYQEQDEVTMVPPDYRIGVFDSVLAQLDNGWTDEIRESVEQTLTDLAERYEDIIAIPRTFVPPPWPRYDDYSGSVGDLMARLVEDGHDLDAVLTYERATQNRPIIVASLEGLIAGEPERAQEEVVG